MAADRGAFICQSQSLNVFMENATFGKLTSMHFYAWERGLKTGMYYLRTKAATDAIKFTVEKRYKETTEVQSATVPDSVAHVEVTPVKTNEREEAMGDYTGMSAEELARQQAAIACSLDNPDSCEMCSG